MCPCAELAEALDPRTDARLPEVDQLAQIDASLRGPTLLFVGASLFWLLVGTLFSLIAAIQLLNPEFIANCEWLTYGRIFPASSTAMLYGFGDNIAFAVSLWIMARLCKTQVKHLGLLYIAGAFWNVAILWGLGKIILGGSSSIEGMEMSGGVGPVLVLSYALIGLWGILSYQNRQTEHVYVSQWYLLAAFLCFPWMYWSAHVMLFASPARGVMQAVAAAWFNGGVANLWFAPIALAAIYYFLPKILGRPIYGYYLATIGFWSLIMFSGWLGTRTLIFGPIPVWIQTVGIVASVALLVPTVAIAINLLGTARGSVSEVMGNPVLRFLVFSALAFVSGVVINAVASLRVVNEVTGLTDFSVAQNEQGFYAFYVMAMFGAAYYMLPRIFGRDWPASLLLKANFWCCALGITLLLVVLYVGGWQQGAAMNDPFTPFVDILRGAVPVNQARAVAQILLSLGQVAFIVNAGGLMLWWAKDNCPVCRLLGSTCPACKLLKGRAS